MKKLIQENPVLQVFIEKIAQRIKQMNLESHQHAYSIELLKQKLETQLRFRKAEKDIGGCEKEELPYEQQKSVGELFSSQDVSIDDDANGIGSYLLRHEAKFRPFRVPCPSPSPGAAFKPVIEEYLERP